jgi:hypothetical protein
MCINDSGHLEIGGCDTVDLARQFGTPLYVFDEQEIRTRCRAYIGGLRRHYPHGSIIYAGKAFLTQAVCRIIEEEGLCLDVVSGGELFTALSAGFPPERIFFHGNNKSLDEIACGIKVGVHRFVVDNLYELEMLETEAAREQTTANVLLRIAPGVEAHTHSYLRTGQVDSKFGFGLEDGRALEAIEVILQSPHLRLLGLHAHIGSQIFEVESYRLTTRIMVLDYHIGLSCTAEEAAASIQGACQRRATETGDATVIIRSDNGPQFVSHRFQAACEELGLEHECIPVRTPNKNAHIEAFHSILEDECFSRYEFNSFAEAYVTVVEFIDYYNHRRLHGSLAGCTPGRVP